jgi:hypothetical protein
MIIFMTGGEKLDLDSIFKREVEGRRWFIKPKEPVRVTHPTTQTEQGKSAGRSFGKNVLK